MGKLFGHKDPTPALYRFGDHGDGSHDYVLTNFDVGIEVEVGRLAISDDDLEALDRALNVAFEKVFEIGLRWGRNE